MLSTSFPGAFVWHLILITWDLEKNERREISPGWFNHLSTVTNTSLLRFLKDLSNLTHCFHLNIKIKYKHKKSPRTGVKPRYYLKSALPCWMPHKYVMHSIWEFWWRADILGFKSDLGNKSRETQRATNVRSVLSNRILQDCQSGPASSTEDSSKLQIPYYSEKFCRLYKSFGLKFSQNL